MVHSEKSLHKLIDKNNKEYNLYVVTNYDLGGDAVIIVNESATGDGAIVFHNGRTQESIPITGELMADSKEQLNQIKEDFNRLRDLGEVVEFVGPYRFINRSNKYFIQSFIPSVAAGNDKTMPFTMTLTEYRTANVNLIQTNAVNFELSQNLINLYNERIGNL